jgi:hypothetical protein
MELGQSRLVEGDKVNTTIVAKGWGKGTHVLEKVAENIIMKSLA